MTIHIQSVLVDKIEFALGDCVTYLKGGRIKTEKLLRIDYTNGTFWFSTCNDHFNDGSFVLDEELK